MGFFKKFDELAKAENSSVNAIAKKLELSSGSLTAWKNGTAPSLKALNKIADYFKVSTDYLLGRTDETKQINAAEIRAELNERRVFDIASKEGGKVSLSLTVDEAKIIIPLLNKLRNKDD